MGHTPEPSWVVGAQLDGEQRNACKSYTRPSARRTEARSNGNEGCPEVRGKYPRKDMVQCNSRPTVKR